MGLKTLCFSLAVLVESFSYVSSGDMSDLQHFSSSVTETLHWQEEDSSNLFVTVATGQMDSNCGKTVAHYVHVGLITLDFRSTLLNNTPKNCTVYVRPQQLPGSVHSYIGHGKVLLFFSDLNIGPCSDEYLEIQDGVTLSRQGSSRKICEDNFDSTKHYIADADSFTVSYYRMVTSSNGYFNLIFSAFFEDSDCDDNHQCSNGYCVSPDYNCSEELNICGEEDSNCDTFEDEAQTNFFSEVFRYGFVIVVVVVFGCFLKGFCKSFKPCEKIHSCRSNYSGHCPDRLGNCMSSMKERICDCVRALRTRCGNVSDRIGTCFFSENNRQTTTGASYTNEANDVELNTQSNRNSSIRSSRSVYPIPDLVEDIRSSNRQSITNTDLPPSYNEVVPQSTDTHNSSINNSFHITSDRDPNIEVHYDHTNASRNRHLSFHELPPHLDVPLEPPPSYEDAVAVSSLETPAPPYEEYIADQRRYER